MGDMKIKKAVIREDLLSITKDYRKAILLNQFIYWAERVSDADKFIEKENEIAKNNGEVERELFYGWIYKTAEELADEVMLGLSASQIRRYINDLVDLGYLSKRNNPKYKWDRTLQYRVNLVNIAKDLKKNGFPLSDYKIDIPDDENTNAHPCAINNEPEENQSQSGECAIPEITTENTNRDYSSEITPNSFSKEKDNSKETLELHNSHFPEEQKNESRISMSLGVKQKQPKEKPLKDMPTRAKKIADSLVDDTELSDGVRECISYFLEKYKQKNHKEHLPLRNETLQEVVEVMLSSLTVIHDENFENMYKSVFYPLVCFESDWKDRREIIDKYFDTKFKYVDEERKQKKVDYSLVHFAHKDVIIHIMQKCNIGADMKWYESYNF